MIADRELPATWTLARLADVVEIVQGQSPPGSSYNSEGVGVPFFQGKAEFGDLHPTVRKWTTNPSKMAREGDVLISVRAPVGPTNVAPYDCAIGRGLSALHPTEAVDGRYLLYGMRATENALATRATGTTFPAISGSVLREHRLPLAPLPEQRRIVAALEEQFSRLDAGVESLERARRNLRRMRTSVLHAAALGRLVPQDPTEEGAVLLLDRIRQQRRNAWQEVSRKGKAHVYREPNGPAITNLPALPSGWAWATVQQVSKAVVDGVHRKPNYVTEGIPFVTVRNLTAGPGISFERLNYVSLQDHMEFIKRTHPERGDLLVSKDGTLGVIRAVRTDQEFSIFVSVALIKPVLNEMTDYLEIALASPVVQEQMVPKGSGLQHIHLEDLRADCVPVPPLAEQFRIVAEAERLLSLIDSLAHAVQSSAMRSRQLRRAILTSGFGGRLVPQDPLDERADILIEQMVSGRIAAADTGSRKKSRRII